MSDEEYGPWIAHNGGPRPVDGNTDVEFVFFSHRHNQIKSIKWAAHEFAWLDDTYSKSIAYRVKKPRVLDLGKEYTLKDGTKWVVIHVKGINSWMTMKGHDSDAYVWTLEGISISLGTDYNVDFSK